MATAWSEACALAPFAPFAPFACAPCAAALKECHICRKAITQRIRAYRLTFYGTVLRLFLCFTCPTCHCSAVREPTRVSAFRQLCPHPQQQTVMALRQ